jgi:hypothetical protein
MLDVPVFVPVAPHDGGLPIGGAWAHTLTPAQTHRCLLACIGHGGRGCRAVHLPDRSHAQHSLAYLGPPPFDLFRLPSIASARGGRVARVRTHTSPEATRTTGSHALLSA